MKKQTPQDKDSKKTKDQLIKELTKLRKRLTKLEKSKIRRKRADEILRGSEKYLQALLDSVRAGILIIDAETHTILDANSLACTTLGARKEQIVGSVCHRYICPAERGKCPITDLKQTVDLSEQVLLKSSGERIPILKSVVTVQWEGRTRLIESFTDITRLKQTENDLREASSFLENIFQATEDGIMISDARGYVVRINRAIEKMLGFTREELAGKHTAELAPQDETHRIVGDNLIAELIEKGFIRNLETSWLKKDGSLCPIQINVNRLQDREGNKAGAVCIIRDITERKRADEALRKSEERFRSIVETTNDAIISADSSGTIIFWNKAAENIYGYSSEEAVGKPLSIIVPETLQSPHQETFHRVTATGKSDFTGQTMESGGKRKDGSEFPVEFSISFWKAGDNIFFTALIRDITKHKQAEEALRESEERFRSVVETAREGIFNIDSKGNIIFCNKAAEEMFGYSFDEIMGKPVTILMPPRLTENYESRMDEVVSMEQAEILGRKAELVGLRKDGTEFPVEHSLSCWETKNGIFYTAILHDITEHKQAEEALRESEERFRSIMDNANDAIFFADSESIIRFWNRKAYDTYGYTADEVIGKPPMILVPKKYREVHQKWMEKYLSSDEAAISGKIVEGMGERKDGTKFFAETSTAILKQGDKKYLVAVVRNITERKKAEEEKARLEAQLRESHKMEAVGLLAGGIAHDFNNILTAIIGYASLLQMKMKEDDPLRPYLEQILTSSQRAASLTQSLLAFGRKQIINPKPVKANDIITKTEKLLVRLIGEDIDLKTTLTNEDTTVMADSGQIEQALMNFATNSRDAMPQGGHFMIETQRAVIDDTYVKTYGYGKPGEYMLISVSDSGTGMDEKTREKVFEPFFTTKEVGKGTGLGLSMVYGIVKQHNGYINCYSEPGKGTTFKIYLPMYREAVELQETMESAPATIGGTETILVAEDDADARKTTRNILENFGYTILEAVDGEDAVRVFKENRDTVKLLLLDVIMPKKNGKEAYEEIRKLHPPVKALFISGYTANIIHKRGILDQNLDFIMKPVSPTALLRKVREVLNK